MDNGQNMNSNRNCRLAWITRAVLVGLCIACSIALRRLPFGHDRIENPLILVSCLCLLGCLFHLIIWGNFLHRSRGAQPAKEYVNLRTGVTIAAELVLMIVTYDALAQRLDIGGRWQWQFEGVVVRAYNSSNHQARTVDIDQQGILFTAEGVSSGFWRAVKPGDKVSKSLGTPFGTLNGTSVRIVPVSRYDAISLPR